MKVDETLKSMLLLVEYLAIDIILDIFIDLFFILIFCISGHFNKHILSKNAVAIIISYMYP